jgi:hypothetical protein
MVWEVLKYVSWGLGVLAAGLGGYLAGYLKKKGEDRAVQENFDELLRQAGETTERTKKIEAEISNEVWDRQKRWELKRDVLFEATRRVAAVEDGLLELDSILKVEQQNREEDSPGWEATKNSKILKWSDASAAFDETRLFVAVVCRDEARQAFEDFGNFTTIVAAKLNPGKDGEIYKKSLTELTRNRLAIRAAVRKELGVDGPVYASIQ